MRHWDFLGMRFEVYERRKMRIYGRFTIFYAEKGGAPVLRGQRSWTKINGFMIRTNQSKSYCFQFRRVH